MWLQAAVALVLLRTDPFYTRFHFGRRGGHRPHAASLRALLHLGVPMGMSMMVEVTGFSFMAIFISRLGETAVAGHQIAINLVSLLFMMPLALANGTSTPATPRPRSRRSPGRGSRRSSRCRGRRAAARAGRARRSSRSSD